jgi:S1-C subfamily serine protease
MKVRARIGVAILLWAASYAAAWGYGDVGDLAREQTFVVQSMLAGGKEADICAGVLVGRDADTLTIATAAHALAGPASALRILDVTRLQYYRVLDVRTLPEYDLAFIRVRSYKEFTVPPVQFADAMSGEIVTVWGHPGTSFWQSAAGVVTNAHRFVQGESGSARATLSCDACGPGDAGAGVFDERGRLVGILTAPLRKADGTIDFLEVEPAALIAQEVRAEQLISAAQRPPNH